MLAEPEEGLDWEAKLADLTRQGAQQAVMEMAAMGDMGATGIRRSLLEPPEVMPEMGVRAVRPMAMATEALGVTAGLAATELMERMELMVCCQGNPAAMARMVATVVMAA